VLAGSHVAFKTLVRIAYISDLLTPVAEIQGRSTLGAYTVAWQPRRAADTSTNR